MQVLVIGCGISGLTTGISLLRAGYSVHIKAKDLPPNNHLKHRSRGLVSLQCLP
uniref:FAD dependent oxidoreductase domain-containing protein n=1 Tax=Thermosporothrix sp. COM3 TaxID=2490863 RepID=A0A455STM8_9CHLR|nr:hypothetical protein KTC_58210 [Thermosporothrix sp. COM3]